MARSRPRQDEVFWQMVKDLRWRLDDGSGGSKPPYEPEFDHGGGRKGRERRGWATHVLAFMAGGLAWGLLPAPIPLVPVAAGLSLAALVALAARRRRR